MVRKLGPEAASLDEIMEQGSEPRLGKSAELEPAEQALLIRQALETLEAGQAAALRAWLAGFSHVEVAELHGWTESVARHRIYRGLERLRTTLGKQAIDG
jgi:DNA-directed RNA polymerase specialized sigma24 family protein